MRIQQIFFNLEEAVEAVLDFSQGTKKYLNMLQNNLIFKYDW